ncbi:hypothetical protein BIV25_32790 [Streptomyces sp. MUSC 14]|nr:hypothetical protein BIV25_32790 [Streptomyces sp. MUSC 14]
MMPGHPPVAVQAGQQVQPGPRSLGLGERDRAVQGDHRVGRDSLQDQIQGVHLRPVGFLGGARVGVRGGDRGLELVRAQVQCGQRRLHQVQALIDQRAVPPLAVLFGQRYQVAGRCRPCLAAGVSEQHQREQPGHLAVLGQLRVHRPGQPDRLAGEVGADQLGARGSGVALVEDQVEHVQHDPQPLLALRALGQGERAAGGTDALLGPADPGRHRGLRHQERARDLGRGQAAHRAQRQRGLGGRGQGRMTAQEQQDERVVGVRHVRGGRLGGQRRLPLAARVVAAQLVDEPPGRDRRQPAARVVRHSLGRPLHGGGEDGLLYGVLAALEPAVAAHQRAEDPRGEVTEQVLDGRCCHASNCPSANIT